LRTDIATKLKYIPTETMDNKILNLEVLEKFIIPNCNRCGLKYSVIGVTLFLNSIAARCECNYSKYV